MIKYFLLLIFVSANVFAQNNFTVEWDSPTGWATPNGPYDYDGIVKLFSTSNIYHIVLVDVNDEHNVRFYNGSTHNLDYSWTWSGSEPFYAGGIAGVYYGDYFTSNKFDVTGDGINEFIQAYNKIVNPVNGNVIYSPVAGYNVTYIIDIDGDGFLEIIEKSSTFPHRIRIISTPAQSVSVENNNQIVKDYQLKQNFPNPFNPSTTIEYTLNKSSYVKIVIYNIQGKEVNVLVNQEQIPGTYKLNFSGSNLSSGTYFYSLIVDGMTESKKMIVLK
ncbi:MAG: hypothetical protein HGGPFJEG_02366 [Ignavibacteria bacterium]|nr:hypothetical protein [Ignavibacteria bacterium]